MANNATIPPQNRKRDRPMLNHLRRQEAQLYIEGPRDASCQLKSCQLPRNSAETTYTTIPDRIDGMKLQI